MRPADVRENGSACVWVALPVGRNGWASRPATLHYEGTRLVKADGIDMLQAGPNGMTGILYLVKESLCRDDRRVLRVERQRVVDGRITATQNWGEVEDAGPLAA